MAAESSTLDLYKKDALVWVSHPEIVWISATLLQDVHKDSKVVSVLTEDGQARNLTINSRADLPPLRNPDILLGRDDLTELSHLHEPAVLFNLRYRFIEQQCIYTYCGIVLVAVNPYQECPHLYSDEMMQVYGGAGKQVRELDPHVFGVAEEARFDLCEWGAAQAIVVSGESGAGKTVSAKLAMRYLAAPSLSTRVHHQVLASNPIMEALGNAKTVRNDNSSRFGKFIQLDFTDRVAVAGAQMRTYLLEKSRVVFQASRERNYHIFYQLCAAACAADTRLDGLHLGDPGSFQYTRHGGERWRISGVDDVADFEQTCGALDMLCFTPLDQRNVFRALAGILHLGNIDFDANSIDLSTVAEGENEALSLLCNELYSIDQSRLVRWLCEREIRAAGEVVRKPLSLVEAVTSRDALAKRLYAALFDWVVGRINAALQTPSTGESPRRPAVAPSPPKLKARAKQSAVDAPADKFIGILDIYGFETFDVNSFEQFCINYANEKLQQQFNLHVFKLEQEEYVREAIEWVRIDFCDNQACIDLIEANLGIIDLLDERCRMGRGTDGDWLDQLRPLAKNAHFGLSKMNEPLFVVKHFADDVVYQVDGFLEKNRDTVSAELVATLRDGKFDFLAEILTDAEAAAEEPKPRTLLKSLKKAPPQKVTKLTVSNQFRQSLRDLMAILSGTRPHFIRCVKPNDAKAAFSFEPARAVEQLRACGVLETVRISAAGYPSRWAYDEFGRRYRVLYTAEKRPLWRDEPRAFAQLVCSKWIADGSKFALGRTKVFFRTGQVAHLERQRADVLAAAAATVQRAWRCHVARRLLGRRRAAVRLLQAVCRAHLAFRRLKYLQMHRAAVALQTWWRAVRQRRRYARLRRVVVALQARARANALRARIRQLVHERKVLVVQRYWRGVLARRRLAACRRAVVLAQCCVRRWLARRRLKQLKIEARSVGHLQKQNCGLEKKIIELQQRLDASAGECAALRPLAQTVEPLRARLARLDAAHADLSAAAARAALMETSLAEAQTEVRLLQQARLDAEQRAADKLQPLEQKLKRALQRVDELERERADTLDMISQLKADLVHLQGDLDSAHEKAAAMEAEKGRLEREVFAAVDGDVFANESSFYSAASVSFDPADPHDLLLTVVQQRLISQLRRDKESVERSLETEKQRPAVEQALRAEGAREQQRAQELQLANGRLRQELDALLGRRGGGGGADVRRLLDAALDENERRRDESAELRAVLASHFDADDALEQQLCRERQCRQQKLIIEQLTRQLEQRDDLVDELRRERQQLDEQLAAQLSSDDYGLDPVRVQNLVNDELGRLVKENMMLQNRLDRQNEILRETRRMARGFSGLDSSIESTSDADVIRLSALPHETAEHSALLEVASIPEFVRLLVSELRPRTARVLAARLPAHLLLLAIRFYDRAHDEAALAAFFAALTAAVKAAVSAETADLDVCVLWLVNCWSLLNLLRQYSAEEQPEWRRAATARQRDHCLQHFDLRPLRDKLAARVAELYQLLLKKLVQPVLEPKIVPAILQHDSVPLDFLSPSSSNGAKNGLKKAAPAKALDDLIGLLSFVQTKLTTYGADAALLEQVMAQASVWLCAVALNHLMFRRELCNFERAMQIKHNVTEVQAWLSKQRLGQLGALLEPLVQASHLLQSRKDDANLDTLCGDMTDKLKPQQIVTLLQHYSPTDGFEESRPTAEFVARVRQRLAAGRGGDDDCLLLSTYTAPFEDARFVHSDVPLERLSLPPALHLDDVARLI